MDKTEKQSNGTCNVSNGLETKKTDTNLSQEVIELQDDIVPGSKNDPFRWYRISKQCMIIAAWIAIVIFRLFCYSQI